jgi:hypothetical protein
MLRWLQAVVEWMFNRHSPLVQLSLQGPSTDRSSANRRWRPDPPRRPHEPDSGVRAPKWYGPTGRRSSVAVAEPVDEECVVAVGRPNSHGGPVVRHGPSDES